MCPYSNKRLHMFSMFWDFLSGNMFRPQKHEWKFSVLEDYPLLLRNFRFCVIRRKQFPSENLPTVSSWNALSQEKAKNSSEWGKRSFVGKSIFRSCLVCLGLTMVSPLTHRLKGKRQETKRWIVLHKEVLCLCLWGMGTGEVGRGWWRERGGGSGGGGAWGWKEVRPENQRQEHSWQRILHLWDSEN